jgi:Pentapeptide repeats (9 copies)
MRHKSHFSRHFRRFVGDFGRFSGGSLFTGDADFRGATFAGPAYFDGTTFTGKADFGDTTFTSHARFSGAIAIPISSGVPSFTQRTRGRG